MNWSEGNIVNHLPYYLYLDSKIIGTAKQIISFFEYGIFSTQKTIVLIKKYKHNSSKKIAKIFKKNQINYCFIKTNDIDNLEKGIVFYPFNAQSNCRAVANRNLIHIFITHGESNKVASVKPILRIYDYIITAGQAGIDRLLSNNIFTQNDVDMGRIIRMGDTFIGRTGLSPKGQGKQAIFYAPTWEGGTESENYSSLSYVNQISDILITTSKKMNINDIVIKPHPNTGHRLKKYINYLIILIKILNKHQINTIIYLPHFKISFYQKWKLKGSNICLKNSLKEYSAEIAFCDISAIETQLLNENTIYHIFIKKNHINNHLFQNNKFYFENIVFKLTETKYLKKLQLTDYQNLKRYMIDNSLEKINTYQRIETLINKITKGTSL